MLRYLNARKQQRIPKERLPNHAAVRIYERQADFSRDVRVMQRQGWVLKSFHQPQLPDRLNMIRASAPGMVPHEARQQIVAHFACARAQPSTPSRVHQPRRRLARVLLQLAERLDCSVAADGTDSTCPTPA